MKLKQEHKLHKSCGVMINTGNFLCRILTEVANALGTLEISFEKIEVTSDISGNKVSVASWTATTWAYFWYSCYRSAVPCRSPSIFTPILNHQKAQVMDLNAKRAEIYYVGLSSTT